MHAMQAFIPPLLAAAAPPLQWRRGAPAMALSGGLGWPEVTKRLDALPVFVVVDEAWCAIEYGGAPFEPRAQFYADAEAAEAELVSARARFPELQLQLQAVGLGFALGRCGGGDGERPSAVILPRARELERARALPGGAEEDWDAAGALPLFGSPQLRRSERGTSEVTPLFLRHADAEAAAAQAAAATGAPPVELRAISLPRMARKMAEGDIDEPDAMRFVPPISSAALCTQLEALSGGKPMGAAPDAVAFQALTTIFDERRQRSAGLFPE